jgi:hypothetical protein
MRTYAWSFLAALALVINSCGSDPQPSVDGGPLEAECERRRRRRQCVGGVV